MTVHSELIMIKLISSWTAQEIASLFQNYHSMTMPFIELFPFFRRADEKRRKWKLQAKHYRYKQLKEQEYFEKYDNAFYRIMVKISV